MDRELHFTPHTCKVGWSSASYGDWQSVEKMAMKLNESRPLGIYFVCGTLEDDVEHLLYKIETNDPLEIIEGFNVGSHNEICFEGVVYGESDYKRFWSK